MRIAISGRGVVTTHGSGVDRAWEALLRGLPGGDPVAADGAQFAARIPSAYRPHSSIPASAIGDMDAGALLAVESSLQALDEASLENPPGGSGRVAIADGLAFRAPGQGTLFVPYGEALARMLGVNGSVVELGGGEASGGAAVAAGMRLIESHAADAVIAGAAQVLQPSLIKHLRDQGQLTSGHSTPFDEANPGCVPGEGSAFFVLEAPDVAVTRGARVSAYLTGIGEAFDPAAEPLARASARSVGFALQSALAEAGIVQDQVDLVVICADGRPAVDRCESTALRRVFGKRAFDHPVVSTAAGSFGSTLAASGPLALSAAVEAMVHQEVFPVARGPGSRPEVGLAIATKAEPMRIDCAVVLVTGTGGSSNSFVLERST